MPGKAVRACWRRKRRTSGVAGTDVEDTQIDNDVACRLTGVTEQHEAQHGVAAAGSPQAGQPFATLDEISYILLLPSYVDVFRKEIAHNERLTGFTSLLQPSSYRRRLKDGSTDAIIYDEKQLRRKRDQMAIQVHANNMRHWSPSLVARSISYFTLSTDWQNSVETAQRRLASRPIVVKVLERMREREPQPEWTLAEHVHAYCFDQTYEWVGMKKRGHRQSVEKVDAQGMPLSIVHEVYVNSIKIALPATLGNLSVSDLQAIAANHGSPYTEDYNNLFDFLRPRAVKGYLKEFSADSVQRISDAARQQQVAPNQMSLRAIAAALFDRGRVDPGGPSTFDILEPLMDCNTMSYADGSKIMRHLESHSPALRVVNLAIGDGQSVILLKNMKVRWPSLHAHWLIGVGGFHEHAHTMFALNQMFWFALVKWSLSVVQIEKVFEVTKDLEHNNYAHVQQAHHVITIAINAFLMQDVISPPPALFLQSPELYFQRVESGTGKVLLQYLHYAGYPIMQWQVAARDADGIKLKKLFAYSHHVFRSVAHKPVAAQISLIALLGFCCALPSLQAVLLATISLSLLGRLSSNMFADRMLEYINKVQQGLKRSAHAASFGRAISLTRLLRMILHVRHAFQESETGHPPGADPVSESMLRMARLLQDELVRIVGRDLTIYDANNHCWHTANSVPLNTGDYRQRRPWEWIWKVAFGASCGKGRTRSEAWDKYAERFVYNHFFPY